MCDLHGLDPALVSLDWHTLSPLARSRVAALQSGAAIFGDVQARFDMEQTGMCALCGEPDTARHRVCECPRFADARMPHRWVVAEWSSLPVALTHHLLPSANPHACQLRALLRGLEGDVQTFHSCPVPGACQHLFTDGACSTACEPALALAAWSVVNATSACVVSCGPLPGVQQTAPRAELSALVSAVAWVRRHRVHAVIWCDAEHVASCLRKLLEGEELQDSWLNLDLWKQLASHLGDVEPGTLQVQHIPSHQDPCLSEGPFEDWLLRWNGHADTVAGLCNMNRPWVLQQVYYSAIDYHRQQASRIRALRAIYLGIADATYGHSVERMHEHEPSVSSDPEQDLPLGRPREVDLEAVLPLDWKLSLAVVDASLPSEFVAQVCDFFLQLDASSELVYPVSWLEFLAMLLLQGHVRFPVRSGATDTWKLLSEPSLPYEPHSAAVQLGLVRRAMKVFFKQVGLSRLQLWRLDRTYLGFRFPCDGVLVGVDLELLQRAHQLLRDFTSRKVCSTVTELCRPFVFAHLVGSGLQTGFAQLAAPLAPCISPRSCVINPKP